MRTYIRKIDLGKFSHFALAFLVIGMLTTTIQRSVKNVDIKYYVIGSDMEGYYQYLPYFFLHNWDSFNTLPYAKEYKEGKTLNVYTCGVAILQSPFFLMAQATAWFFQIDANRGYSNIHFSYIFFAALFYGMVGLWYLYKSLLRMFPKTESLVTVSLIFMATNLYYYTIFGPGLSHVYSFALISIYIYFVPGFYKNPVIKSTIRFILPIALATLIRPTNLIAILYFLFYGVGNMPDLKQRVLLLISKWYLVILMAVVGIIVFIPQMAYWYKVTGNFFVYSYQGYGFPYLTSPRIFTVLFGPRNGWFLYTPIMFLATFSLIYLALLRKYNAWIILIMMVIIVYLNGSWWAPTFSASVGYRALIEFLPFMAIPLAFFLYKINQSKNRRLKITSTTLMVFFVIYNILFSFKYSTGRWWDTPWTWDNIIRIFTFS